MAGADSNTLIEGGLNQFRTIFLFNFTVFETHELLEGDGVIYVR